MREGYRSWVIRQGSGEIVPWRQPSEEVDARNYLPCPLCLGFFLRADLWKHQVCCRKKLSADPSHHPASKKEPAHATYDPAGEAACDPAADRATKETPADPAGDTTRPCSVDQNQTSDSAVYRTRKRIRVQAAASRLLPISSGASESCSEILHRMNQDNVSYEVKSDWLICKYGNKLMGNQDNSQRRYDYVSQKLRELGRLLLAAKSLDSDIQTLHDLLAPGRLSFALSAARKAAGYRWSRPPMALKTTLKTICEIAMAESLQQGDWEAAAKTTDFYHLLGRQWDNLGLQNPDHDPETAAPDGGPQLKKQLVQSGNEKNPVPDVLSKDGDRQLSSLAEFPPPESRLQTPVPVPMGPRKVRRRPWSTTEKEAIWRQLGVHVLVQSVPGKEVCQRCLDLEPVLRGRHWKDIKNQIHNQIQSQKKQQFHAQMDLEENQELQDQIHNQRKQQLCQAPMDQLKKDLMVEQDQDNPQNQKRPQYLLQINHQAHNSIQNQKKQDDHSQLDHQHHLNIHKKQLCHARPDGQDQSQDHKKQLYQMDQQTQPLHALDQDSSILAASLYGPDGPLRGPGHVLPEREPGITPYPLLPRGSGPQMAQLLTRTEWTEDALVQNYPVNRTLGQNLLLDVLPRGPPPDPHSGHVHF
ncbi:uncharacterized protein LOC133420446 [Cololabis saira]|uniref:uncharacterized protein LOC133420446 n=1 Tax=Cololabis saira TaxID=129043 RepID=UPI002AD55E4A|nr:uncharacterized protein LOC133420446 [Cololabis saira]